MSPGCQGSARASAARGVGRREGAAGAAWQACNRLSSPPSQHSTFSPLPSSKSGRQGPCAPEVCCGRPRAGPHRRGGAACGGADAAGGATGRRGAALTSAAAAAVSSSCSSPRRRGAPARLRPRGSAWRRLRAVCRLLCCRQQRRCGACRGACSSDRGRRSTACARRRLGTSPASPRRAARTGAAWRCGCSCGAAVNWAHPRWGGRQLRGGAERRVGGYARLDAARAAALCGLRGPTSIRRRCAAASVAGQGARHCLLLRTAAAAAAASSWGRCQPRRSGAAAPRARPAGLPARRGDGGASRAAARPADGPRSAGGVRGWEGRKWCW